MKNIKLFEEFAYGDLEKDQWVDSPYTNKVQPLKYRLTPEFVEQLQPNEVFVFGSNLQGVHTAGARHYKSAASSAIEKGWADSNQIEGISRSGKAYAIPTQSNRQALPLNEIKKYVDNFFKYAKQNPNKKFLVTMIGAGYSEQDKITMAKMFSPAVEMSNVHLPWPYVKRI